MEMIWAKVAPALMILGAQRRNLVPGPKADLKWKGLEFEGCLMRISRTC